METVNARIKSTHLGFEDHGIMTAMLYLEFGSVSQGFGGHNLNGPEHLNRWVRGLLNTLGKDSWEQLAGSLIRVRREGEDLLEIGHILEEKWFKARI